MTVPGMTLLSVVCIGVAGTVDGTCITATGVPVVAKLGWLTAGCGSTCMTGTGAGATSTGMRSIIFVATATAGGVGLGRATGVIITAAAGAGIGAVSEGKISGPGAGTLDVGCDVG